LHECEIVSLNHISDTIEFSRNVEDSELYVGGDTCVSCIDEDRIIVGKASQHVKNCNGVVIVSIDQNFGHWRCMEDIHYMVNGR